MELPKLRGMIGNYLNAHESVSLNIVSLGLFVPLFKPLHKLREEDSKRRSEELYKTNPNVGKALDFVTREYLLRAGMAHNLLGKAYEQINGVGETEMDGTLRDLLEVNGELLRRFIRDCGIRIREGRRYEFVKDMEAYDPLLTQVLMKKAEIQRYGILKDNSEYDYLELDDLKLVGRSEFIEKVEHISRRSPLEVFELIRKQDLSRSLLEGIKNPFESWLCVWIKIGLTDWIKI